MTSLAERQAEMKARMAGGNRPRGRPRNPDPFRFPKGTRRSPREHTLKVAKQVFLSPPDMTIDRTEFVYMNKLLLLELILTIEELGELLRLNAIQRLNV